MDWKDYFSDDTKGTIYRSCPDPEKYTVDFLNHNIQRNNGELPQYLVKNHHPAIIDEELFETVQEILQSQCCQKREGSKERIKAILRKDFVVGNAAGFSV